MSRLYREGDGRRPFGRPVGVHDRTFTRLEIIQAAVVSPRGLGITVVSPLPLEMCADEIRERARLTRSPFLALRVAVPCLVSRCLRCMCSSRHRDPHSRGPAAGGLRCSPNEITPLAEGLQGQSIQHLHSGRGRGAGGFARARATRMGDRALSNGARAVRAGAPVRRRRGVRGRAASLPGALARRQRPREARLRPLDGFPRLSRAALDGARARRRAASATTRRSRSASAPRSRCG